MLKQRLLWLMILLTSAFLFGMAALRPIMDPDIYFQLLAGQYTLNHFQVPHIDFFVYAGENQPQIFGGWGFGVFYELFIRTWGMPGASFANGCIWGIVSALTFACAGGFVRFKKNSNSILLAVVSSSLCLAAVSCGFGPRAGMRAESSLYLMWMLASFFIYLSASHNKWNVFLIGMPLISWCEAWIHTGGFFLLLLYPLAYFLCLEKKNPFNFFWIISLAMAIFLPVLNPNGASQCYSQIISIYESTVPSLINALSGKSSVETFINVEYLSLMDPRTHAVLPSFVAITLGCLVCLSCMFGPLKVSQRSLQTRLYFTFLLFLGVFAAFTHQRGIGMAACLTLVPLLDALLFFFSQTRLSKKLQGLLVVFSLLLACANMGLPFWGVQTKTTEFTDIAKIIHQRSPHGARIFASDLEVGLLYLLGPSYKMAHAGHELIENSQSNAHNLSVLNANPGFIDELNAYKVDYLCIPYLLPLPSQSYLYWAPSMLATQHDWKLLHASGPCALFAKLSPEQERLTDTEVQKQTLAYLIQLRYQIIGALAFYNNPSDQEIKNVTDTKIAQLSKQLEALSTLNTHTLTSTKTTP